jgi:tape measure domain-containing protein
MATELGTAYVQIMPSAKGISGSIQKVLDPEVTSAGKSAGSNIASSMAASLGNVGGSLTKKITLPASAAISAAGGIVAAFGWKRLVGLDSARAQLQGLGYDTEAVDRISKQVSKTIQGTTTTMAEGVSVAAGALAAGVKEGAELERYIKLVGDAAVGANRQTGEMATIFNRVQGAGKLMTQELNMIEDGMPGFAQAMADSLGVPQDEFRKMVTEGKVSSEQFLDVMEDFAGDMSDAYAGSWEGMVANTKANIGIIGESILGGVFEQSKDSIAEFLQYLRSDDVREWAAETGETIGEAFGRMIESVKSAIEWWTGLDDNTKTLIMTLAGIVIAIGPALTAISKIITAVQTASKIFGVLKTAATVVGGAIGAISAPVLIAIAAIAAIIAIGILLYKNWDTVVEYAKKLGNWIKNIWDNIKNAISNAWNSIKVTTSNVWNGIKNTISNLLNSIRNTFSNIFNGLRNIVSNAFSNVRNAVRNGMTNAWNVVTGFFGKFRNAGRNIVTSIADGIRGAISKVTDAISSVTQKIRDFLPFSPAKEGPLKDLDKLNFGGTISLAIDDGADEVQRAMEDMLTVPLRANVAGPGSSRTAIEENSTYRVLLAILEEIRLLSEAGIEWNDRELARLVRQFA